MPKKEISKESLILFCLAAVQFTNVMDFVIMMPLGPQFMRAFSIGPAEFGYMISAYTFSAAIFGFLGAFFVDRFDRKRTLLVLYAGFTLGTFLCAVAPSHSFFIFARAFAGAFGGIMGGTVFAIIGDVIPEERRGAATGTVMMAFSIASIFGLPTGLYLANLFSWHAPFYLLAALSLLILILGMVALPPIRGHVTEGKRPHPVKMVKGILSEPVHLKCIALTVIIMLGNFSVIPYLSPSLVSNAGLLESQLPLVYFFGGMFTLFTSRFIGKQADKLGKQKVFVRVALLSLIPILAVTHLPRTPVPLILVCTVLFSVLISGRMVTATALITSVVKPASRGGFMSLNSSIQQAGSGVGTFIAGLIVQKAADGTLVNYGWVGWLSTLATVIAIGISFSLRPRFRAQPSKVEGEVIPT